jgi:hypothetical protein
MGALATPGTNEEVAEETVAQDQEQPTEGQEEAEPQEAESEEPAEETPGEEPAEEGAKDEQPEQDGETKRKRAGGWQRKIERLERQNQILTEQLVGRQGQPPATAAPGREKTPEEKGAEYIDTLVDQRLAARESQRQAQAAQVDFQRRTAEVRAAKPDFDDVIMSVAHVPVPPHLQEALLTSEQGPAIMYQLAMNPSELARISALPAVVAVREIGRLEAKLPSVTASPKAKLALRPPAPPTNVNGKATSTRSLDDLPISEYKRAYRSGRR